MEARIRDQCKGYFLALEKLWKETGVTDEEVEIRIAKVSKEAFELTNEMVKCESDNLNRLKSRCLDQRKEIDEKIRILKIKDEIEISSNLPLMEQNKLLRSRIEELEVKETEMTDRYRLLKAEELELSNKLDIAGVSEDLGPVPSTENISILEANTLKLKSIAEDREQTMLTMKEEIISHLDSLEVDLNATAIANLIVTEDQKFDSLKQTDLDVVQNTLKELRVKVATRRQEVEDMVSQVKILYLRLEVDQEKQCPISTGKVFEFEDLCKGANREKLEEELERLRLLQKESVGRILDKNYNELSILLEECMISSDAFEEFLGEALDDDDEELKRVEKKLLDLRCYKEDHKVTITKLKKFLDRCQLAKDLQLRVSDPNRLFKSRGLAMAKEEADRKTVNTLPSLKEELLELAETDDDIMIFDQRMSDLVEQKASEIEQIYESSLSTTSLPSKSMNVKSRNNITTASTRSLRNHGRGVSPRIRRTGTRNVTSSAGRTNASCRGRSNESYDLESKMDLRKCNTMGVLHGPVSEQNFGPRILVNDASQMDEQGFLGIDASQIDEDDFKENIQCNSTQFHKSPRLISRESTLIEKMMMLDIREDQLLANTGKENSSSLLELQSDEQSLTSAQTLKRNFEALQDEQDKATWLGIKEQYRPKDEVVTWRKHRRSNSCSDQFLRPKSGNPTNLNPGEISVNNSTAFFSKSYETNCSNIISTIPRLTRTTSSTNLFLR